MLSVRSLATSAVDVRKPAASSVGLWLEQHGKPPVPREYRPPLVENIRAAPRRTLANDDASDPMLEASILPADQLNLAHILRPRFAVTVSGGSHAKWIHQEAHWPEDGAFRHCRQVSE